MSWEEVSAIGQVLGSIAVFVTLGYLTVQVRHAHGEFRRSIRQGRGEALRELHLFRAGDPRMIAIANKVNAALGVEPSGFIKELMERAALTRDEAMALNVELIAWWSYRSQVISHIGELPPEDRLEFDAITRAAYSASYGRLWYEPQRGVLNPVSVRYIDNLLAQCG
jgi:hypothetical protein